ncbi:hypothetical protein GCM10022289_00530 [Pedobacter jeongneungensis]|uniref:RteC protein n=1 Tax=Pedobacter jeongneungensis TaxID=947309 RepID=A0ABP8B1S3_9SPHI
MESYGHQKDLNRLCIATLYDLNLLHLVLKNLSKNYSTILNNIPDRTKFILKNILTGIKILNRIFKE